MPISRMCEYLTYLRVRRFALIRVSASYYGKNKKIYCQTFQNHQDRKSPAPGNRAGPLFDEKIGQEKEKLTEMGTSKRPGS